MTLVPRMLFAAALPLLAWLTWPISAQTPAKKETDKVSYYKDVRPIFQQHCQGCHQPAKAQGGFVMTGFAELFQKTEHDNPGIVPGKPALSAVYKQITPQEGKPPAMPRGKEPLADHGVNIIQ